MDITKLYRYFTECSSVVTDTRDCKQGALFIALRGKNFDGNAFARQALELGCRYALVDEEVYAEGDDERIVLVDDCLTALQQLANYHRRCLSKPVIGITGTNGKTTTKELIASVLKERYKVLYTEGNLNNHIGVPLTLLRMRADTELAVVEMGASHPGEIAELCRIAEPDYGIITNVGRAHLEGFGSFEGVVKTKGELYDYLRGKSGAKIFIHNENPYLNAISGGLDCIRYGTESNLYVSGRLVSCEPFVTFSWTRGGISHEVKTHLIGKYNVDNLLAAVAFGCYFGIADERICNALENYVPRNNRSQFVQTEKNQLIVDAYNANPSSMRVALENFRDMPGNSKMVVLGDMKELGVASEEEHRKVVNQLKEYAFARTVLVGTEFGAVCDGFEWYATTDEAIAAFQSDKPEHFLILIKGSNSMKLSCLPEFL